MYISISFTKKNIFFFWIWRIQTKHLLHDSHLRYYHMGLYFWKYSNKGHNELHFHMDVLCKPCIDYQSIWWFNFFTEFTFEWYLMLCSFLYRHFFQKIFWFKTFLTISTVQLEVLIHLIESTSESWSFLSSLEFLT